MDLLVEKLDGSRYYLSQYKMLVTDFEESAPTVARNSKQIDQRNGSIDFGGWHTEKTISVTGYYRADDMDEEEKLREKLYALLSEPEGYYITQLKTTPETSVERPGETSGGYYDKLTNYPSHKRFLVYTEAPELELVGNVNGTLLYKLSVEFKTIKLPYGETPANDISIDSPYKGLPTNYVLASHAIGSNTTSPDAYPFHMQLSEDLSGKTITTVAKVIVTNYQGKIDNSKSFSYIDIKDAGSTGNWEGLINHIPITGNGVYTSVPKTMTKHPLTGTANFIDVEMNNLNATVEVWVKLELGTTASQWSPNPADPEYYADKPYDDTPVNLLTGTSDQPQIATGGDFLVRTVGTFKANKGEEYTAGVDIDQMEHNMRLEAWTMLNGGRVDQIKGITLPDTGRYSLTFTAPSSDNYDSVAVQLAWVSGSYTGSYAWSKAKTEVGGTPSPWSPNPADPEYHEWLRKLPSTIAVPYAGSVPCNQLEQGFAIELTALSSASSLSFKIGDAELTYNGDVAKGDVFRFSGFSYTKNNLSIVDKTNKAYFVLRPDKSNRISCNVFGKIRVLGFQNFYA